MSEKTIAEMEIKKADELRKQVLSAMDKIIESLENGTEVEIGKKNSININTVDYSDYDKPITTEDTKSIKSIGRKNLLLPVMTTRQYKKK